MATQSPSGQTTGAEIVQPENVDNHSSDSATSVFMNSEPIREDQVQNAVKFLSHPKVRGSPVIHRRTFLERKGLSKEEIDEAFRRVPDSPPSVQTQDGQLNSSSNTQQQGQSQALQPVVSASTAVTNSRGILSWYSFHWSHALVTVGFLIASSVGTTMLIKKSVLPRLKSWIRNVVFEEDYGQLKRNNSKPSLAEEVAHAAKAAAAAAAEMAKASQEMLSSKSEEKRYFVQVVSLLDKQVQEMKVMTNAIRRLEGGYSLSKIEDHQVTQTSSKIQQLIVNGKEDYELRSGAGKSSSAPVSVEPSSAPHPKSYMEIMAMIQRGEKPSNIRDIDDSPPNPYQQPSNPRLAPRAKPWEVNQVQTNSTQVLQSQVNGKDFKIPESWSQTKNVRIRETDNEIEYNGAPVASSQQPVKRVWVPPQPPPVAMSEAAEAIRRPKPVVPKELRTADQPITHSSDISDGVEIISKSNSEGAIESSRFNSPLSTGEIQGHEVNHEEQ